MEIRSRDMSTATLAIREPVKEEIELEEGNGALGGETEKAESAWTTDTLRLHVLALLEAMEVRFDAADAAADVRNEQRFVAQQQAIKDALCVHSDTLVLCADLEWRRAGELKVGDELVAVEEATQNGSGRRFVKATVTGNFESEAELLLVKTADGEVYCNPQHPWLRRTHSRGRGFDWKRADKLKVGDVVSRPFDVWDTDRSYEAGWLAGILDGEGCLTFHRRKEQGGARVSIGQVAGKTADAIAAALTGRVATVSTHVRPAQPYASNGHKGNAQAQQRWSVDVRNDVMKLLGSVRPLRLLERSDEIWEGRLIRCRKNGTSVVVSVEPAGTGTIANLSTSAGTFIANGFVAKNTSQKEAVAAALVAAEKAVLVAETNAEKWRGAANEWRGAMNDRERNLMPRSEAEQRFTAVNARMDASDKSSAEGFKALTAAVEKSAGRREGLMVVFLIIAALATIFGVIMTVRG